jgi:hypothetical protein
MQQRMHGLPGVQQQHPLQPAACAVLWRAVLCAVQDYTHYHLDMNATRADLMAANITTFNLALLGVLANLHGNVAPEYRPFVDVLMQAISRQVSIVLLAGCLLFVLGVLVLSQDACWTLF